MVTKIDVADAMRHLADYLPRAVEQGERILVERDGVPVAALVGVEDLRRLEALTAPSEAASDEVKQARYRRLLEEAGLVVQWPTGDPVQLSERQPIEVEGPPLSEQIIADRR